MKEQELWAPLYSEHLNSIFYLSIDNAPPIELELVKVTTLRSDLANEQFSLLFRAPPNLQPIQLMGKLEHEKLDAMEMLLVPVSRDENNLYFEAVFNRFLN